MTDYPIDMSVAPIVTPGQSCDDHPDPLQRMNRCADGLECVAGGCVAAGARGAFSHKEEEHVGTFCGSEGDVAEEKKTA